MVEEKEEALVAKNSGGKFRHFSGDEGTVTLYTKQFWLPARKGEQEGGIHRGVNLIG